MASTITSYAGIKEDTEKELLKLYSNEVQLDMKKISIDSSIKKKIEKRYRQRFYKSWLYFWKIKKGDNIIAFALLDNVYGKTLPITFLTVFDLTGKIVACRIIKYREPHGGEVKNLAWLTQFIGKDFRSSFKIGGEIDSLSGATISSNALIRGNGKLTTLVPYLIRNIRELTKPQN